MGERTIDYVDQRDRKRLVFVVALVEHPYLPQVAGNGNAVSVVVENDSILGGFVAARADLLAGCLHVPKRGIQEVLCANLDVSWNNWSNASARP